MLKVGITGGIGSGKSTVCQVFKTLGIPILHADDTARYLMTNDETLIAKIRQLLGDSVYINNKLNRTQIASIVFKQPEMLEQLNAIVHPAVKLYSEKWMSNQATPYAIKEAAIFFESGTNTDMDVMIGVYASLNIRIHRVVERDAVTHEQVLERISQQMDEDEKMKRCDYVINNDDKQAIIPQVLALHKILLERVNSR
jgi:dephospho-CoA kinase